MKREARGCGTTCDCVRMNTDFSYLELCYTYVSLIRDNFLSLDDVSDQDWETMNLLLREEAHQKQLQEEHAKKVKEILG